MNKCLHFWSLNIINLWGLQLFTVHQHKYVAYKYFPIRIIEDITVIPTEQQHLLFYHFI